MTTSAAKFFGTFNEWGPLQKLAVRTPETAFISAEHIATEWRKLNYHSAPDFTAAKREYDDFLDIIKSVGAEVIELKGDPALTLDSIYTRDALVLTPQGLVRPFMGKPARRAEPIVNGAELGRLGFPLAGEITSPGLLEGGDLVWIDDKTLIAGIGYRTNLEGISQLANLAGDKVEIISFDLPYYLGANDVFHLMSFLSPLDHDLALVYRPLMPVRLVQFLEARGIRFIDVPEAEFPTMACNVLALGPRHALMVEGNIETEKRLRAAGVKLEVYKGYEISRKGEGGPTCLTRPLKRG